MKNIKIVIALALLITSCNKNIEMKFDKIGWNKTQTDSTGYLQVFASRQKMLQDLTENEKLKGLTLAQLTEKLGKPADYVREQNIDEGEAPNTLFYDIGLIYSDVEPFHYIYLEFEYDKNKIITDFKITDSRDNQVTTGCWSYISNKSDNDIIVEIAYEEKNFDGGMPHINIMVNEKESQGNVISYDSINFIAKIKVLPKQKLCVEGMQIKKPSFRFIKSMTIFADKKIILDSKDKMKKSFIQKDNANYELEIN